MVKLTEELYILIVLPLNIGKSREPFFDIPSTTGDETIVFLKSDLSIILVTLEAVLS